ncbi:MAG: transglutaminase-like domain-containing protein, partial [Dorea phocaeensis]
MFTQKFMQEIERSFEAQLNRLGERRTEVETVLSKCSDDEAEALKCLYASMPVSDAADYEAELFLSYAKHGVFLWEAGPFAGTIPEEIFAGYILHHRVNNEDLTPCRPFFYEKLHKRIEGLSMAKAILEINYWCAEEATYRTTDDRTASAECVYRSAYGRCGEESTFAVSVFRSVGIPARQVYVPLWSHCDDNHAWVEVWSDGMWKFLGACEPEEVLNKGWFTNASSRAMMVHSRWLLPVRPKEELVGRTGMA